MILGNDEKDYSDRDDNVHVDDDIVVMMVGNDDVDDDDYSVHGSLLNY